ncbi:DUF4350 domain-containing protein [Gemmatimonas groenlandica]|uniref:DUF4350 domain-containing protein n=1 Tax=Gemmatimonas groenlandica TaxID=2732249 RepID=A0A6M4IU42_9BACT|nr:DUF4350 domain-containing protein [Gemmatimonas groenlandica]QJR37705.1 hypothetical protein HKW67_20355 [Gemmatimonas groenlandica]
MTNAVSMNPSAAAPAPWYTRPGRVIALLAALVAVTALLARTPVTGRAGDPRLSTSSADPLGAKLIYELADRLAWNVSRDTRGAVPTATTTIYSVLDPVVPVTPEEAAAMLAHVRRGGAMLLVLGEGTSPLSDSLKLTVDRQGDDVAQNIGAVRPCVGATRPRFTRDALWFGNARMLALQGKGLTAPGLQRLVLLESRPSIVTDGPRSTMVGMPYGAGRLVVAADPDVFRNDALRDCRYGLDIASVRALEYLSAGGTAPRRAVVFDEFHQGRTRFGMTGAIERFLGETPPGRVVLQLALASLLLLFAAAPRVLPPRDQVRVERRSPLEHVDALARAYVQVGATRTSAQHLVRGLRRRMEHGAARGKRGGIDEDQLYLSRIADVKPALASDIAIVRHALTNPVDLGEFRRVGQAIQRIEAALTRT